MITLSVQNLHVSTNDKKILKGVDLTIRQGEVHVIMGPNGSGKSTLARVLMGHPLYTVVKGKILLNRRNIIRDSPEERAHMGLFLCFQSPQQIPGLHTSQFLRAALNSNRIKPLSVPTFRNLLQDEIQKMHISPHLTERYLNEGFSGGEMKKTEILQMALLKPKIAILDEIDSGLDIDALKVVCKNINTNLIQTGMGLLLITHYNRILQFIRPDTVHIMTDGAIIRSGSASLAGEVDKKGFCIVCQEERRKKHPIRTKRK